MPNEDYILGIDTSNYKTSVCILNHDEIVCDLRRFLHVDKGERGLRQSEALFQHIKNLPELMEEAFEGFHGSISAISFSSRPRPLDDSYMPVFLAGEGYARAMAASMDIPVFSFSHQEGHIQAIKSYTEMSELDDFLACHFSGGTCEILRVHSAEDPWMGGPDFPGKGYRWVKGAGLLYDIRIVGGSRDISFGQVIDRAGVEMGFSFPCGDKLDEIAVTPGRTSSMLTPIKVINGEINLSGIDTQIKNKLKSLSSTGGHFSGDDQVRNELIREIFQKLSMGIVDMLRQACKKSGLRDVIMSGGVSSSRYIRQAICDPLEEEDIIVYFDDDEDELSTDNAVGTALLGGRFIWDDHQ